MQVFYLLETQTGISEFPQSDADLVSMSFCASPCDGKKNK